MIFLGTLAVLALLSAAISFAVLVWRFSWGLEGHVAAQLRRLKYEEQVVAMLRDYIKTQRHTNDQLWMALQVHADRLNRCIEKRPGVGIQD
jgi:hypothetical protein